MESTRELCFPDFPLSFFGFWGFLGFLWLLFLVFLFFGLFLFGLGFLGFFGCLLLGFLGFFVLFLYVCLFGDFLVGWLVGVCFWGFYYCVQCLIPFWFFSLGFFLFVFWIFLLLINFYFSHCLIPIFFPI